MDNAALCAKNRGAYSSPFSGVGQEFFGLGIMPDHSGMVMHETGYLPRNEHWNFPKVMSPFWRLYYNLSGGHCVMFGDREIELTPDHLVIIPDHQFFHCRSRVPAPTLWLHFNLAKRWDANQPVPLVLSPNRIEVDLIRDIVGYFERDNDVASKHERIYHASLALLHVMLNRAEIRWQAPLPEVVRRTVRHIEEHFASRLSVPQLARLANLCPEALERSFKKHRGESIWQFLLKVRVREAAHLLLQSDRTLDEIAQRTGFSDRGHLSRVFKKSTGESPAQFRRLHS